MVATEVISLKETENMKKKKKSEEAKRQGRKLQNILCCIKSETELAKSESDTFKPQEDDTQHS